MRPPPDGSGPFDWVGVAPGDEAQLLALESYNAGRSFPEVAALPRGRGFAPEFVPKVLAALAMGRAAVLLASGKSRAECVEARPARGGRPRGAGGGLAGAGVVLAGLGGVYLLLG